MLQIDNDGTVHLTRGDTARFSVSINNDTSGSEYEMSTGDVLKLTVKKTVRDTTPCIQKVIEGSNNIHISPEDTNDLEFGKYLYDVELNTEGGDVYTVIGPTTFEILKEVTC